MAFINSLLVFLALYVVCSAAARLVFLRTAEIPASWKMTNSVLNSNQRVTFKIALVPKDAQRLEKELLEIATPGNPRFRKYLNQEQITAIVGRSDADIQRLSAWLSSHDLKIDSVHPHRDWVTVSGAVSQIEALLECKLAQYTNEKLQQTKIGERYFGS